jgi:hypothetical protein
MHAEGQTSNKLLHYRGHKAGGKFQPNSPNARQALAFKIPKGRSGFRSLRPDDNAEEKTKHDEDLRLKIETISRLHDQDKGAV